MPLSNHPLPNRQFLVNRALWAAIFCVYAVDAVWMLATGVTLHVPANLAAAAAQMVAICAAVSLFACYVKRHDTVFLFGHTILLLMCQGLAIGILSYLGQRLALPMTDETLIAIDRALGFDWLVFIRWVDTLPRAQSEWLTLGYESFGPQIIAIIFILFLRNHPAQAQRFIIGCFASGLLCVFFASTFPAVAGYVHYDINAETFHHFRPSAPRIHEEALMEQRNHTTSVIATPLKGLVTFPSFHASVALLVGYASLVLPYARLFFVPLNLLMMVSVISDGGHYLVDALGGIVIAAFAIYIAEKALPRSLK